MGRRNPLTDWAQFFLGERYPWRNHARQIWWRSLKGFRGSCGSNFSISHWLCWSSLQHSHTKRCEAQLFLLCCQELPFCEWLLSSGWIFLLLPTPLPFDALNEGGSPRSIGFIFDTGKLEWPGCSLVKVAWWSTQSFGHNASTWQTHRQPRRHSKCHANALRRTAKMAEQIKILLGWTRRGNSMQPLSNYFSSCYLWW